MRMLEIVRNTAARLHCRSRHRAMVADLDALSDRQLDDMGLWRGAIPATATEFLSAQGCPAPGDDGRTTTDRAA